MRRIATCHCGARRFRRRPTTTGDGGRRSSGDSCRWSRAWDVPPHGCSIEDSMRSSFCECFSLLGWSGSCGSCKRGRSSWVTAKSLARGSSPATFESRTRPRCRTSTRGRTECGCIRCPSGTRRCVCSTLKGASGSSSSPVFAMKTWCCSRTLALTTGTTQNGSCLPTCAAGDARRARGFGSNRRTSRTSAYATTIRSGVSRCSRCSRTESKPCGFCAIPRSPASSSRASRSSSRTCPFFITVCGRASRTRCSRGPDVAGRPHAPFSQSVLDLAGVAGDRVGLITTSPRFSTGWGLLSPAHASRHTPNSLSGGGVHAAARKGNSSSSAVNYTLYAIGGTNNRFQGNSFESCAGTAVGYVNSGQHEEGAIILGNRYDSTNSFAQIYVCIRNGTIANNVFRNTQSNGALALLGDHLATEVCDNLTITGNSFLNTGFGVRGDPTGSLGQTTPMRNIVITGNTFENVGPDAAIGITICNGLVVSGNVLVNCNSTVVYILGVNDAVVSNNVWEWTNGANNGWAISCGAYISGYGYSYTASNIHIHSNSISGHLAGVNVASVTAGPPGFAIQVLCTGVTISHNTWAGITWGILINDRTADVAIIGNKILPSASWDCQIATTCQIRDNQLGAPLINMQSDPTVTYYFQREGGQKVFRPSATQPPNSPPSGASYSFATGDVTYSSNPVPGSAVAWVYSNG